MIQTELGAQRGPEDANEEGLANAGGQHHAKAESQGIGVGGQQLPVAGKETECRGGLARFQALLPADMWVPVRCGVGGTPPLGQAPEKVNRIEGEYLVML